MKPRGVVFAGNSCQAPVFEGMAGDLEYGAGDMLDATRLVVLHITTLLSSGCVLTLLMYCRDRFSRDLGENGGLFCC